MEANRENPLAPETPEAPPAKLPSFGTRLAAIFVEPKVVFDYLARRSDIWPPFIALAVMAIVAGVLALPASIGGQALIASAVGRPAPEVNAAAYVKAAVSAPINIMVGILLIALVVWLVALLTTGSAPFGRAMSVAAWSLFPATLGALLNGIVVAAVHPEVRSIHTFVADQSPVLHYTSLGALFTGTGPILSMVLLTISVFYLWQLWLLFIAARRSFGVSTVGAWTLLVVLLLLQVGFAALGGWGISLLLKL